MMDQMTIQYQVGVQSTIGFIIHDIYGALIQVTESLQQVSGDHSLLLDELKLSIGLRYILSLEQDGIVVDSKRLIVK